MLSACTERNNDKRSAGAGRKDTAITKTYNADSGKTEIKEETDYSLIYPRDSIKRVLKDFDTSEIEIIAALNRVDKKRLKNFDTLIIPADTKKAFPAYFPFRLQQLF